MDGKLQFYSRALGTTVDTPVTRVNYTTTPPVRWCPHCGTSQQVGFSAVCSTCKAMWIDATLVEATQKISAASVALGGREVDVPAAPLPPPEPEIPQHEAGQGFEGWSLDELADAAEKARKDSNIDLVLELVDEFERRQGEVANHAAATFPVQQDAHDPDDDPDARMQTVVTADGDNYADSIDESPDWLDRNCGFCGAIAGEKCRAKDGAKVAAAPHAVRLTDE